MVFCVIGVVVCLAVLCFVVLLLGCLFFVFFFLLLLFCFGLVVRGFVGFVCGWGGWFWSVGCGFRGGFCFFCWLGCFSFFGGRVFCGAVFCVCRVWAFVVVLRFVVVAAGVWVCFVDVVVLFVLLVSFDC